MKVKPLTDQEYADRTTPRRKETQTLNNKGSLLIQTETAIIEPLGKIDQEVFVISSDVKDPSLSRHLLPSRGFFYGNKKDITLRSFKVGDLKKLQHFLQTNNITHLIDAIQNCVEQGVDVRELTYGDFLFIVFKIVFSSHPNPEYKFKWTSFYANENEMQINPSSLDIIQLNTVKLLEELPDYPKFRLTPCLVKSYEALHNNSHNPEDDSTWDYEKTWLYEEVARFLDEASPEEQLLRAENMSLNSEEYVALKKFKTLIEHSVKTTLQVRDTLFEPTKALEVLEVRLVNLEELKAQDVDTYEQIRSSSPHLNADLVKAEIERIKEAQLSSLELCTPEVEALEESVTFRYSLHQLIGPLLS